MLKAITIHSSFKSQCWAGRSVWYDRNVGIVEVAGSNPAPSTCFSITEPISIRSERYGKN
jgi:hypothetical protein